MSSWVERKRAKNNGDLTLDRAGVLNVIRTEAQIRPHDGFKAEALHVNYPVRQEQDKARTLRLAKPPAWTETELPCVPQARGRLARAHMDKWDAKSEIDADALCTGCPVRTLCLKSAIEEERGMAASGRYMVRGGVTPAGRARLEQQLTMLDLPEIDHSA